LFRRGKAQVALKNLEEASADFKAVLDIDPSNQDAKNELLQLRDDLAKEKKKQQQFFGKMFEKLEKDEDLYSKEYIQRVAEEDKKPKTRTCQTCGACVEEVQWARHVIKHHSK